MEPHNTYQNMNYFTHESVKLLVFFIIISVDLRNTVNATCKLIYRFITADMLTNSVTLRLDDLTPVAFMTHMYKYTVQALAAVLEVKASSVYVIDIKVNRISEGSFEEFHILECICKK